MAFMVPIKPWKGPGRCPMNGTLVISLVLNWRTNEVGTGRFPWKVPILWPAGSLPIQEQATTYCILLLPRVLNFELLSF